MVNILRGVFEFKTLIINKLQEKIARENSNLNTCLSK